MKFTIGTVSSNLEFEEDLKLIKSSLLYADEVELIGMAEYTIFNYLPNCVNSSNDVFDLMDSMIPILKMVEGNGAPELLDRIKEVMEQVEPYMPYFRKKKKRNKAEIMAQLKIKKALETSKAELITGIEKLTDNPGSKAIKTLINNGTIIVHDYNDKTLSLDSLAGGYFGNLIGVMKNGTSYPLFDKSSVDIISNVLKNEYIDFSKYNLEIIRHAGVSTNILMTLPGLEYASIDEILDFKKENEQSLVKFRASIYDFSEKIKSLPWDDDFQYECAKLYARDVLPKVEEINEIATDTSVSKNMSKQFLRDAEVRKDLRYLAGGLATRITTATSLVTAFDSIRELVLKLSLVVIAPASIDAFMRAMSYHSKAKEEVKKIDREIKGNSMFYYYKASEKFK